MDLGLRGKVALVAAASQGMGRAIATELAREGAKVALCSRDEARVQAAASAIGEETGGEVLGVRADVTRGEDVQAFVEAAVGQLGAPDVLVTNAGGPPAGGFEDVDDAAWDATYDLTFLSAVRLIRACLPHMKKAGGGRVVVMTSISVKQPVDNLILSNAVRLAVVGLAKTLTRELAPHNITVNVTAPGYIATARLRELFEDRARREGETPEAVQARLVGTIPMGRLGEPREMAALVAFLASDRAAYLTGNVIQLDGGMYAGVF